MKWLKKLFPPKEEIVPMKVVNLWGPLKPPFYDKEKDVWVLVAKVEVDGMFIATDLYFQNEASIWSFQEVLTGSSAPYEMEIPEEMQVLETEYDWNVN